MITVDRRQYAFHFEMYISYLNIRIVWFFSPPNIGALLVSNFLNTNYSVIASEPVWTWTMVAIQTVDERKDIFAVQLKMCKTEKVSSWRRNMFGYVWAIVLYIR